MDLNFLSVIEEKAELLRETADYLWENPETAFTEYKAAALLTKILREEGFEVEENLAGIATAFSGTYGSGKPVIGILGEFDALSGLGQVHGVTHAEPNGCEAGQGCGHNLFAAGALGAAIAVKKWLQETGNPGTVIFFGTPGEEGGSGKGFMARDGVFDGLDAALTWHPDSKTFVRTHRSLANYQILYKFDGIASHAGGKPELGRSALDAVALMNTGVQYLREHIPSSCRVHYAITDTGGFSPNVVQAHSEVLYLIRAVDNPTVKDIYERINDIAKGAALMTGTKESHEFIKACSNTVPNTALQTLVYEKMHEVGSPEPTEEDLAFARRLIEDNLKNYPECDPDHPIWWEIDPYDHSEKQEFGSTDVGDVSWVCPTCHMSSATIVRGTPPHSWQEVAQGKLPLAHRATRYAAKVMAASAVALMTDPETLRKAKDEHAKRVGPKGYEAPIPKDVKPRSMDSLRK